MATPTIPNGEEYFFPIIYEGNGAGQRVGKFVPFTDNGTIDNSCIFEKGDSPRLNRTPSGTGTSRRKYTLSLWAKPSLSSSASDERYIITAGAYGGDDAIAFDADRTLKYWINGRSNADFKTNRTFKDSSKFYHILVSVDTTQATASDRVKIYVDGDQITSFSLETYPSQNYDGNWGNTVSTNIGSSNSPNRYYNGYLAEVNYVDGTALGPSTFGVTDTSTGRWVPKALTGITYGTNGFRLKFQDSSALGDDTSGNGNDLSATNLSASDQTTDSPTQNHATIDNNSASNGSMSFSEGNLKVSMNNAYPGNVLGTLGASSGKYYWEVTISGTGSSANGYATGVGVAEWSKLNTDAGGVSTPFSSFIDSRGSFLHNGTATSNSTTFTAGDVISIALNLDDSEISYFKNNSIVGSAQPLVEGQAYFPLFKNSTTVANLEYSPNFGQKSWNYTPPTGFVALQQDNLPETAKGISGLVWTKNRDATDSHQLYDSSRGKKLVLASDTTGQESTVTDGLQKFLAGGQQIEDNVAINTAGESFVTWNWVANGGTTESNTDGNTTVTLQKNTTAGFSIGTFTSTVASQTLGHGLGVAPEWIILKRRDGTQNWFVYHKQIDLTDAHYLHLNNTDTAQTGSDFGNTLPTSTVFTANPTGVAGRTYIFYAWNSVEGYSKFGKYTGNGNADGPFVYTGFRPAWILFKANNSANWYITDNKMFPFNPNGAEFHPNTTSVQTTLAGGRGVDYLSNGFKIRQESGYGYNYSGVDVFYMAFAEHPFVGDGTSPVTAR